MPRYTWRGHEPRYADAILDVPPCPARLFDAAGRELTGYVFYADTETGEVGRHEYDAATGFRLAPDGMGVVEVWERHPAPLRVVAGRR